MDPPFPWLAMLALAMCLISHRYTQCSQFAYVGYMVEYLGVAEEKDQAGYYVGSLTSISLVGRFTSAYFWGQFADRYGRLPVIYVGLWSIVIFSIGFGLSTTFCCALSCRLLLGMLNGISAVSRTMVSEICDKKHEVVGMGVTTTAWSVSLIMGPGIGGLLSEPATYYPQLFPEAGLLGRYPYLLPNVVGAAMALVALPMVLFLLPETKQREINGALDDGHALVNSEPTRIDGDVSLSELTVVRRDGGYHGDCRCAATGVGVHDGKGVECEDCYNQPQLFGKASLLAEPRVRAILFLNGLYSFVNIGFDEIFPLWALSSKENGGLDWTTQDIGQVMSVVGICVLLFEIFVKPFFIKRVGVRKSQRWGSLISVGLFLAVPLLPRAHRAGLALDVAPSVLISMIQACSNTMYINVSLATNNAVDSSRRGELNGLAGTVSSLATAASPFTCSIIFAWSLGDDRHFPLDSHLIYILLALGMLAVAITGWDTISLSYREQANAMPRSETMETRGSDSDVIEAPLSPLEEPNDDVVSEIRSLCDERQGLVSGPQSPRTYNT